METVRAGELVGNVDVIYTSETRNSSRRVRRERRDFINTKTNMTERALRALREKIVF
jgi:hypothetical protein